MRKYRSEAYTASAPLERYAGRRSVQSNRCTSSCSGDPSQASRLCQEAVVPLVLLNSALERRRAVAESVHEWAHSQHRFR